MENEKYDQPRAGVNCEEAFRFSQQIRSLIISLSKIIVEPTFEKCDQPRAGVNCKEACAAVAGAALCGGEPHWGQYG